jgi:formylglycine-generating enzyme required for sulfatase activity
MGSWLLESGIQQVRYLLLAALLLLAVPAQAQDELLQRNQARQFESQVVRVLPRRNDGTTAQTGFGIIVGQRGSLLIVAVPAHVVWDSANQLTDRPMVRFRADRFTDIAARRFPRQSQPDDLALLEVPLPAGMTVPRATIVPDTVLATRFVFAIGAGDDWEVSARAGTFGGVEQNRQWRFGSLNITPGTSGGAIVTSDGIAAMVLTTTGNRSFALPASRIREVFAAWDRQASLLLDSVSRRPGELLRDCTRCPELVVVPSGSFTMGSPLDEDGRAQDEGPQRPVTIRGFAAGRYEVTVEEWGACVDARGCQGYRPESDGSGRGNLPIVGVNWDQAQSYIAWLSSQTGFRYRLLTEAEWEYATRAGTTTRFWRGNSDRSIPGHFNIGWIDPTLGTPRSAIPVGQFGNNSFGLSDVHGNVAEWVQDCFGSYSNAPRDGSAVETPRCNRRVLRGGSFFDPPEGVRSARRDSLPANTSGPGIGFRVARDL